MAQKWKRNKSKNKSKPLTDEEIKSQIKIGRENGFNNRWDLINPMDNVKFVTFKYGNRKFIANSASQDIKETQNNGEYSMDLRLKPGDVIMYGESNWFCTHGESRIVDMMAIEKAGKPQVPFHYERGQVQAPVYKQQLRGNLADNGNRRGIGSDGCGSQFCAESQEIKMEYQQQEHDEDVVQVSGPCDYFISREIRKENGKVWGYLNNPLKRGDVIYGPGDSKDLWIVSKKMILRRTYLDHKVIREDIKIACGEVFDVGDNVHYACHFGKRYALIDHYFCADTIKMRIRARNKNKAKMQKKKQGQEMLSLE